MLGSLFLLLVALAAATIPKRILKPRYQAAIVRVKSREEYRIPPINRPKLGSELLLPKHEMQVIASHSSLSWWQPDASSSLWWENDDRVFVALSPNHQATLIRKQMQSNIDKSGHVSVLPGDRISLNDPQRDQQLIIEL